MGRIKTLSRLERLDELVGILKAGEYFTASEVAGRLAVSSRTLMRDLNILRKRGYPVESDRGRGGGIRLHRQWGIGRIFLNYHEVIDLLLSLAIMERIGSPLFLGNLTAVRHKIAVSFPREQRQAIQDIRQRILIGDLASDNILDNYPAAPIKSAVPVYEAFFEMKKLHITYQDGDGKVTQRVIEPHYLLLNWPAWYILARDHLREDARCFRLDRINGAKIGKESFNLDKNKNFPGRIEQYFSIL